MSTANRYKMGNKLHARTLHHEYVQMPVYEIFVHHFRLPRRGEEMLTSFGPQASSIRTHFRALHRKLRSFNPSGVSGHFPSLYHSTHVRLYV